jgi:hypothetical protein
MANENELNELRERIGRLPLGDQFRLLEWILGDHRRRCDEAEAAHKAAVVELFASIEAQREQDRQRESLAGQKRAAG